jgi:hypothetical protein
MNDNQPYFTTTPITVTRILHLEDFVRLGGTDEVGDGKSYDIMYDDWQEFLRQHGEVSMPFTVAFVQDNAEHAGELRVI